MNCSRCLERIHFTGPVRTDLETLRALQIAFLQTVPFENLDIHLGCEISLAPDSVFDKIVNRHRGGFCYECNILFHDLLTAIGFDVDYLSARMTDGQQIAPHFAHMALAVHLEKDYLVDVGNGQSVREPLGMDGSNTSTSEGIAYRVGPHSEGPALFLTRGEEDWKPRFYFDPTPRAPEEFAELSRFHQTSPNSPFTRRRLATLATPDGRITLLDTTLTVTNGAEKQEGTLQSDAECLEALRSQFGIDLPSYPPVKCPPEPTKVEKHGQ